jgi:CheY-like chemotaxis protein
MMSKVLVIEDDIDFSQDLCRALQKEGFHVFMAQNGKQGIAMYQKYLADLVITDILMPEQDGIEVIMSLRKDFPDIKIIAISGGGQGGTGQEYLESARIICNMKYTLAKPFSRDELFYMINEVLSR